jgi:hypothetical protein
MKKLAVLFLLFCSPLWATTYYVDNCGVTGNDSNSGTSTSTAWLTINKVKTSSFAAGDSILFRKTCTWREELDVPSSGSAGHVITIGAYGSGSTPPTIDGSNVASGFASAGAQTSANLTTDVGSGDWTPSYATVAANAATAPDGSLSIATFADSADDEEHSDEAWWPASDNTAYTYSAFVKKVSTLQWVNISVGWSNGGIIGYCIAWFDVLNGVVGSIDSSGSCTTDIAPSAGSYYRLQLTMTSPATTNYARLRIDSASADGGTSYAGAGSVVYDIGWVQFEPNSYAGNYIASGTYTPYSVAWGTQPNQVFSNGSRLFPADGLGYMSTGSWWWASNTLYVRMPGDAAPSSYTITASDHDYNIYTNDKSFITIQNLKFNAANIYGIDVRDVSSNITIQNDVFRNAFAHAIRSETWTTNSRDYLYIGYNDIQQSGGNGISVAGPAVGNTYEYNTVCYNDQLWNPNDTYPVSAVNSFTGGIYIISATYGDVSNLTVQHNTVCYNALPNTTFWMKQPINPGTYSLGMGIWFDTLQGSTNVSRYNSSYSNGMAGMFFEKNKSTLGYYNLVYNNGTDGIIVDSQDETYPASGVGIYSNTSYGNARWGIWFSGAGVANSCLNNVAKDNISTTNGVLQFLASDGCNNDGTDGSGNVFTYNAFGAAAANFLGWGNNTYSTYATWEGATGNCGSAGCSHSVQSAPLFVTTTYPVSALFRPTSSSPVRGAGVGVGLTTDFYGTTVPSTPDVGAAQYVSDWRHTTFYNGVKIY